VLSYRVLFFEREGDGEFRMPASYPRAALATVSTHDLPTLAGWWAGRDLEWREQLALFPAEAQRKAQLDERATDRTRLARALGIDPAGASADALSLAAHEFVARSAAMVAVVQIEDALGVAEQANLPGTLLEHPNWRRKLPETLEAMEHDARIEAHAGVLARERPRAAAALHAQVHPRIPRATYRLQLHRGFTFDDAAAIAPYLEKLGVSHAYCSPVLRARAGSAHGYDVVSHGEINPELGGRERFERMAAALRAHGIGILLDVVPNHMCIGADNAWWLDVLENGPASAYASYFDIDWEPIDPDLRGQGAAAGARRPLWRGPRAAASSRLLRMRQARSRYATLTSAFRSIHAPIPRRVLRS
jgi:(1->4)-alpha-D-glucan 1-alpha-D-glucosylmutase